MQRQLDKASFKTVVQLLAVRVPARHCSHFLKNKRFKPFLVDRKNTRSVVKDHDSATRLLLLHESISDIADLQDQEFKSLVQEHAQEVVPYQLEISFDQMSYGR